MAETIAQDTRPEVGREEPAFPPFNAATFPSQLFWFALVFIVLYLLMSRVALPRVGGIFEVRRTRIGRDLDEAARMQRDADAAGTAYEKTLADAKANAQGVAQAMRDRLHTESETRRKDLESGLNEKLATAEAQIARTRSQAMGNVESIARDAAAAIIQQLTGKPADSEAVARAVAATKSA